MFEEAEWVKGSLRSKYRRRYPLIDEDDIRSEIDMAWLEAIRVWDDREDGKFESLAWVVCERAVRDFCTRNSFPVAINLRNIKKVVERQRIVSVDVSYFDTAVSMAHESAETLIDKQRVYQRILDLVQEIPCGDSALMWLLEDDLNMAEVAEIFSVKFNQVKYAIVLVKNKLVCDSLLKEYME